MLDLLVGGIFSGLASRSASKRQDKQSKEQRAHERLMAQFEQEAGLRQLGYSAQLQDYLKQKDRNRLAAGYDNFFNPAGKPGRQPAAMPNIQDFLTKMPPGP